MQGLPLLGRLGWGTEHFLILDLSVGHGAIVRQGGYALADVARGGLQVGAGSTDDWRYVCPLFPAFLQWFYQQAGMDLDLLPTSLTFTREEVHAAMHGD